MAEGIVGHGISEKDDLAISLRFVTTSNQNRNKPTVMAGLVPAIYAFAKPKTWIPGIRRARRSSGELL
jgi:hypothetical protein